VIALLRGSLSRLQKPLMAPQSGQVQVTALQLIPQKFSSMQSEQIIKPQGQVQQKGCSALHALHRYFRGRLRVHWRLGDWAGWSDIGQSPRWNALLFAYGKIVERQQDISLLADLLRTVISGKSVGVYSGSHHRAIGREV